MINKDRLLNEFIELIGIDSLSLHEREMTDRLMSKLKVMGIHGIEDEAGKVAGGNSGNLLFCVKGDKSVPPILLSAHMDTVGPAHSKKPWVDGDIIKTDGTTILGGDDVAGISCILETIRHLQEQKISHGDIQVIFTIAEENGLHGAKNLDYSKLNAKFGFVLDSGGNIGSVAIKAPTQNIIEFTIIGKAAHAGVEPEKGISAIIIAAQAISRMKLGRIDHETTANIGVINGGTATNIITERVHIKAEARSRNEEKLLAQTRHMIEEMENAATQFGGSIEVVTEVLYPSYSIDEGDEILDILRVAATNANIELKLETTGGGSDTNIYNGKGIPSVNISVGMDKVHSVEEQISILDMEKATEFLISIIKSVK